MTTFPGSPRVLKGAIVSLDRLNPIATVVVFQYNPETLTRKLTSKAGQAQGNRWESLRIKGAPDETISMKVEIDAVDQLEKGDPQTVALGIYPQLAALEIILYPTSAHVVKKTVEAEAGTLEISPPESPLTVLAFGLQRIVPVRISSLSITEKNFDTRLNPILADVDLELQVLTYDDFPPSHKAYSLFLAYQVIKEVAANLGAIKSASILNDGGR
jgi:hypothetical protein